jgi:hypothetical protein
MRTVVPGTRGPDMMQPPSLPHHHVEGTNRPREILSAHYYIRILCCPLAVGLVGEGENPVIRGYGVCPDAINAKSVHLTNGRIVLPDNGNPILYAWNPPRWLLIKLWSRSFLIQDLIHRALLLAARFTQLPSCYLAPFVTANNKIAAYPLPSYALPDHSAGSCRRCVKHGKRLDSLVPSQSFGIAIASDGSSRNDQNHLNPLLSIWP